MNTAPHTPRTSVLAQRIAEARRTPAEFLAAYLTATR